MGLLLALALAAPMGGCVMTSDVTRGEAHALVARGARLVDVRSPSEFDGERHPDEAVNIPLERLRARMGELDRSRPVVVYCHTGLRAAIAVRWLRKAGYAVHNLSTLGHWYHEPSPANVGFQ